MTGVQFTDPEKVGFIEYHLFNELKYLLCAAVEWQATKVLDRKYPLPDDFIMVYSMDSAFVHARAFYEFFTMSKEALSASERHGNKPASWAAFGLAAPYPKSKIYKLWYDDLHRYLMHMSRNRSSGSYAGLNNQIVEIAKDILSYWDAFTNDPLLAPHKELLNATLQKALTNDVNRICKTHGVVRPF